MAHAVGFGPKTQCRESTTGVILVFVLTFTHVGYQLLITLEVSVLYMCIYVLCVYGITKCCLYILCISMHK